MCPDPEIAPFIHLDIVRTGFHIDRALETESATGNITIKNMDGVTDRCRNVNRLSICARIDAIGIGKALGYLAKLLAIVIKDVGSGELEILLKGLSPAGCVPMVISYVKRPGSHRDHIIRTMHQG